MTFKVVNNGDAGDAAHYGGNDIDKVGNLFNGVANVDTVTINSNTTFQNGKLTIQGHIVNRVVKTGAYNIAANDEVIECDCNAGAFTVTLPTAVGIAGQGYVIKRADSGTGGIGNLLTINTTGSQLIDGVTLNVASTQWILPNRYSWVVVYSDNVNWKTYATSESMGFEGYRAKGATLARVYTTPTASVGATAAQTVVASTLYALPFPVLKTTTFDISIINVTAGGAGSTARTAIYFDNGNMYPGALVTGSDVGTYTTTGTGVQTQTFATPITLQPGLYWLAFNCSATAPTVSGIPFANLPAILGWTNANPPVAGVGWSVSLAFAAMPATFTASGAAITAAPCPGVWLRATA